MLLGVKLVLLLGLSVCLVRSDDEEDDMTVDSPGGTYRGHIVKTRNDRDVLAFQGIPFAEPPLGKLRFKDPVKLPKLEGVYNATDETRECYQPTLDLTQIKNVSTYIGAEDCLYLNVYKPKVYEGKLLPVMVWMHGGGFFVGSGSSWWNGPKYLLDRDMIFVATNYRLGVLGFLSTGDSVIPGNLGMKDQVMALRWVQENIASFGGDPNSVTIGGVSAGGGSVSLLMHSKLSKGLFHRVIAHSGSAYCPWASISWDVARVIAGKVASYLGCSSESNQFLNCLQRMPTEQLFEASVSLWDKDTTLSMDFLPVLEEDSPGAFLTRDSFNHEPNSPLIVGVTSVEALSNYAMIKMFSPKYQDVTLIGEEADVLFPKWGYFAWHPKAKEISRKISEFYFGREGLTEEKEGKLVDYISDIMFNYGAQLAGRRNQAKTFLFVFSYKGDFTRGVYKDLYQNITLPQELMTDAVGHGEDCTYLFEMKFLPITAKMSEKDMNMSNQIIDMWYNFMRTSDPTPESKVWEESEGGVKYLDITNEGLIVKSDMFKSRMDFIDSLNIGTPKLSRDEL